MSDWEITVNAMLAELTAQRNSALDRCVNLASELALIKSNLQALEKANMPQAPATTASETEVLNQKSSAN